MSKKSLIKRVSVGFAGWVSMKWITKIRYIYRSLQLLKESFFPESVLETVPITSIR